MNDDIVTRLRNNFAIKDYPMLKDHCHCCAIPKEWGGHHDNCLYDQAADEIERLRKMLDDVLERENKDNARQLEIVRKVEANRDMWRNTCTKLVGMMLPFSLLMKPNEQEELTIILREATNER